MLDIKNTFSYSDQIKRYCLRKSDQHFEFSQTSSLVTTIIAGNIVASLNISALKKMILSKNLRTAVRNIYFFARAGAVSETQVPFKAVNKTYDIFENIKSRHLLSSDRWNRFYLVILIRFAIMYSQFLMLSFI